MSTPENSNSVCCDEYIDDYYRSKARSKRLASLRERRERCLNEVIPFMRTQPNKWWRMGEIAKGIGTSPCHMQPILDACSSCFLTVPQFEGRKGGLQDEYRLRPELC